MKFTVVPGGCSTSKITRTRLERCLIIREESQ
jgi:hypothetical protein